MEQLLVRALRWKHLLPGMIDLVKRSGRAELLDQDNIPFADIQQNMKELNTVNTLLGGHVITIEGVKQIIGHKHNGGTLTICEIGCGGGDNLAAINEWCRKKNIRASFIGIDIKPECIAFAKSRSSQMNVEWIVSDYAAVDFGEEKPGIIFSSLFCHHFKDAGLVKMLQWMQKNSSSGFFINDLQRHTLAYYSIKILTTIFSRSYLVKNDAPLSVARGFIKSEWIDLLQQAGIQGYTLQWKWAFRYLITYSHDRGK